MCEADNDLKWDDKSWKPKYGDYRPTIEEIQKMMPKSNVTSLVEFINNVELRYHDKFNKNCVGYLTGTFYSMKELWFAFVIYERYKKIWYGNTWIKEVN